MAGLSGSDNIYFDPTAGKIHYPDLSFFSNRLKSKEKKNIGEPLIF